MTGAHDLSKNSVDFAVLMNEVFMSAGSLVRYHSLFLSACLLSRTFRTVTSTTVIFFFLHWFSVLPGHDDSGQVGDGQLLIIVIIIIVNAEILNVIVVAGGGDLVVTVVAPDSRMKNKILKR